LPVLFSRLTCMMRRRRTSPTEEDGNTGGGRKDGRDLRADRTGLRYTDVFSSISQDSRLLHAGTRNHLRIMAEQRAGIRGGRSPEARILRDTERKGAAADPFRSFGPRCWMLRLVHGKICLRIWRQMS
jgi:hypothetical protein